VAESSERKKRLTYLKKFWGQEKNYVLNLTKSVWATFWAVFSTYIGTYPSGHRGSKSREKGEMWKSKPNDLFSSNADLSDSFAR
jgi:hypothetical protein